jgi:hypothetical protein
VEQRKAFEAWARTQGWSLTRVTGSDDYAWAPARAAWAAWQELAPDAERWRWALKRNRPALLAIAYSSRAACAYGLDEVEDAYAAAMREAP